MSSVPAPTNSGIITNTSGERHIPESLRPDGSIRKAIKIRPGFRPAEDAVLYKNRTAESFRNRNKGGVIGAEAADNPSTSISTNADTNASSGSAAANKNAKRREARKKAATADKENNAAPKPATSLEFFAQMDARKAAADEKKEQEVADPEAEVKKKARNLAKKLKQAKDLQSKKEGGQSLLPEQIAKVIKINELVRELAALGLDTEGEPVEEGDQEAKDVVDEEAAPA